MKRWFAPNLSVLIWLVFFLALNLSDWRLVMISADGDPALHRRIGEWMIEHQQVIRTEQFSHTRFDAPLISKEWLSEVIWAGFSLAWGWNGVVFFAAFLIATTLWLLHRQLLSTGTSPLLATGLVLLTAFAATTHWLARPHLVTHLLVVVFVWVLNSRRRYWLLPVLMLFWTNLHGAFFTGFILMGIFFAGTVCERRFTEARLLAGVIALSLAASLVNPNGWHLHAQVVSFLRTPELSGLVNEFRSPNFHNAGARGFLFELSAIALTLLIIRPVLSPTEILLLGVWGFFSLHSVRNIPILGFVAAPILARHLQPVLHHRWITRATELHQETGGYVTAALVAAGLLYLTAHPATPAQILPSRAPVAAVEFVKKNPNAVNGEMFNEYGWGGYLMWAMPQRKVFIDGRNDFFGKELVEEFNRVDQLKPDWAPVLEQYRVGWTILPPSHPLHALLATDAGWTNVFRDEVAWIYSRR